MSSGVSRTTFFSFDGDEFCKGLKLLFQQKQAGSNSDIIVQEIVAIVDNYLNTNVYLRNNISNFYLNVIYYTQRKNKYKYSYTQI